MNILMLFLKKRLEVHQQCLVIKINADFKDVWELTPDHFSSLCDQTQLADIDLYDCSFCDDAQGGVEGRGGVLLHSEEGEAECSL